MSDKGYRYSSLPPSGSSIPTQADDVVETGPPKRRPSLGQGEKLVGGASGPGYNFTGITPGSKEIARARMVVAWGREWIAG